MTTIGSTIAITGELTSGEEVTVNGSINGEIHVRDAALTIGEDARLRAEIHATRVIVRGHVQGAIVATERIELTPTAAVEGSLSANRVILADGTRFNGGIDMGQRTIAARVAHFKESQDGGG